MRIVNYFHIHTDIYYRTEKMNFDHIYIYLAGIAQVFSYGKLYAQIYFKWRILTNFKMTTDRIVLYNMN